TRQLSSPTGSAALAAPAHLSGPPPSTHRTINKRNTKGSASLRISLRVASPGFDVPPGHDTGAGKQQVPCSQPAGRLPRNARLFPMATHIYHGNGSPFN